MPLGQFGTRMMGGKDHASARYIFTNLSPVTRHLFNEMDDNVLTFLEEEGQSIEPTYYLPIAPLSLINGAEGIGTGWSTFIPMYNPNEIVANLKQMMKGNQPIRMKPWYKGF
jgi:DNA topoisomerase-2